MRKADVTKQENGNFSVRLYHKSGKLMGHWRELTHDDACAMAHNWGMSGRVSREWPGRYVKGMFVAEIPLEALEIDTPAEVTA